MAVYEAATMAEFDEHMKAAEYVVVDFYGDYCGACVFLEPYFREAANDMPYIRFVKVHFTKNRETSERYGITALPTLKFFHNGQEVHEDQGGMDREALNEQIAKMLYRNY